MEVLEIRPARVSAALVAIGDMLVSSPIGADGPRPSRWIGAVTEHIVVEDKDDPAAWRQWRVGRVDGVSVETAVIPADGWVWVHLPVVDGPVSSAPAGKALPAGNLSDSIPSEAGPERDAWLATHGWSSYDEWTHRGMTARAVQPTVNGIRGHLVRSPEEDEAALQMALSIPPMTAEDVARLLLAVPLRVGDHVHVRAAAIEEDEGVGIVRKVSDDGDVWVESVCNMWRGYPPEMFVKTDEPLSPGVDA